MKKLVFVFACALPFFGGAQELEGVITFEKKVNVHRKLGEDRQEMKAYIPEFQTSKTELLFTSTALLYRELEAEDEMNTEHDGANVMIKMQRPENVIYWDLQNGKKVEQREFFGKKFLIEDELVARAWKISGESKKILDYACQKAVFKDTANAQTVVGWFTPAIPSQAGPESYGHLPGMILEIDINDGEVVIIAQEVTLKELLEEEIKAPKGGKKVTDGEYQAIVEEKMKEFNASGRGGIRIITRRN